ncbi:MAG: FlgD immunoglobulin-like domain containing protein [Nitrososphaera sp.]|uniref:FlgD immunoglobulin-like domain containing protein n=1 Tax=Nitrososphaera sp. TaxID=1971748 RepID=UPI003D6E0D35
MIVDRNTLQKYLLVFFLTSIIIINLELSVAMADDDKDDKEEKGNDDEGKNKDHNEKEGKDDRGQSDGSSEDDESDEKIMPDDDKGETDEPKEEKLDPQQSPPPQQSSLPDAPSAALGESPVSKELGKNESERVPLKEQRAVPDSLTVNDAFGKTSANVARPVHDSIATGESIASQSAIRLTRSISESLILDDSSGMNAHDVSSDLSVDSELRLLDNIATSGLVVTLVPPRISMTSPPVLHVLGDQDADIMFHSTVAGMYSIDIRDAEGVSVNTLEGNMLLGANSVSWDGKGSGSMVPAGDYMFYVTAKSPGGVRNPPAEGDGQIIVAGLVGTTTAFRPLQDMAHLLAIPVVAAAVTFFILRRKKSLTFYLPPEAAEVVDDIRGKYPDAKLEEYIQPAEEGMQRYTGVTIQNPKDVDDGWLASIAKKVKDISGAESVNVSFGGKTHIL